MKLSGKKIFAKISATIMAAAVITTSAMAGFEPARKIVKEEVAEAAANVLSNEDRGVIYANSRTDFRDESIYFLITTRFYDGDPSNNARTSEDKKAQNPEDDPSWRGDFAGLIEKLDYIKALGFTAIWITPVVQNDSGYDYHGYHAYNFKAVDNRYESNGITYQTLIDAVHAKGMKVIQDIVLNHTCNWGEENLNKLGGTSLQQQLSSDVYGTRNQVVMNGKGDPLNIYHHNAFCGGGDWDNYEAQRKTIADDCFDLETENPVVNNYLIDAYTDYINMGVDGFRIDTVKHISRLTFNSTFLPAFKKAGGDNFYMFGEVCTKGHDVWYRDAPPISTAFYTWADDASWTGQWSNDLATNEALVEKHYTANMDTSSQPTSKNAFLNGNDYHTPDYSKKSGMDVIDFQMHWSFNNANEAFNTAKGEDAYFNDSTWNVVYVDSHDYGPDNCQTLRYNGGTDAWAENMSLMFTFRGIPCIYYGSEIEFQAGKVIDVGPNQPLSNTGRAYFGDNIEGSVYSEDFTVFGNLDGKVADTLNQPLSQHLMRLNRIRQAVPALRKGQYSTEGCSGNIAFKRRYTDSSTDSFALVAISGNATFTGIPNGTYVDAVTGDTKTVSNGTLSASVSGKGNMKVYVLNTAKTKAPGRVIPNGAYLTDGGAKEDIGPVEVHQTQPTSVSVSKTAVTVMEAASETVSATVAPSNASQIVSWSSSDNSVATVSGGKITGVSVGTATVTAKTSNGLTATVKVTVTTNPNIIKPTGVTLNKSSLTVLTRKSEKLTATVLPSNASNKDVTWSSSNPNVATVDGDGNVAGVNAGTATITVKTNVGGYTASCNVTVEKNTSGLTIYCKNTSGWSTVNAYVWKDAGTNMSQWPGTAMQLVDEKEKIYAIDIDPEVGYKSIIFNNGGAQTADLTIPTDGKNMFTLSSSDWSVYSVVTNVPVSGVSLSKTSASLTVGDTTSLSATVSPSNATNQNVTWTSSNSSVASVNGGVVTAKAAGTAVITVTTADGNYRATCNVTVNNKIVVNPLSVKLTTSTQTVAAKGTATLTAAATGGSGSYKYTYSVTANGNTLVLASNISSNKYDWTAGTSAGTKTLTVKVTDGAGKTATSSVTVTVQNTTPALAVKLTSNKTSVAAGGIATLTATATGGTGKYRYTYSITANGNTVVMAKDIVSNKYDWKVSSATGTKTLTVKVTDAAGKTASSSVVLTVTGKSNLSVTLAVPTTITAKTTNSLVALATGGNGAYRYTFRIKDNATGKTAALTGSQTSSLYNWYAGVTGTKTLYVDVTDASGNKATSSAVVTVKSSDTSTLAVKLTSNKTSVTAGGIATLTATATGGTGKYRYTYSITANGKTVVMAKDIVSNKYDWKVSSATGTKTLTVKVTDAAGKTASASVNLTVVKSGLSVILAVPGTINLNSTNSIVALVTGGTGNYKYTFRIKNNATGKEAVLAANQTSSLYSWKAGAAGAKTLFVDVTDSNGNQGTASSVVTVK